MSSRPRVVAQLADAGPEHPHRRVLASVVLDRVSKVYGRGSGGHPRTRPGQPLDRPGRVPVPRRRLGLRQEHAAEPRRRPRPAHRRSRRRAGPRRPDVPGGGAVPVADGRRQHQPGAPALAGCRRATVPAACDSCSHTVRLDGFGDKRPHELSGGMRQRVALARAFAQDADILLMDEPFGALDAMTRDVLHDELERLWEDRAFSVVFVTHNVREAARLADRIVLLSSRPGRVVAGVPGGHPAAPTDRGTRREPTRRRDHRPAPGGGAPPCRRPRRLSSATTSPVVS